MFSIHTFSFSLLLSIFFILSHLHFEGGTLYHVSELINELGSYYVSVTIIDGQNEETITRNLHNEYNPCLPLTIEDIYIDIIFSSEITSFEDWFPSICTQNKEYRNEYMFDGGFELNIHNLRVNDYTVDSNGGYGLMRCSSGNSTYCTDCHFENITNQLSGRPLFTTNESFHFSETTMTGITSKSPIITSISFGTGPKREFVVKDCIFSNVMVDDNFLEVVREDASHVECKMISEFLCADFSLSLLISDLSILRTSLWL